MPPSLPFNPCVKYGQRQLWCNGCLLYHVVHWDKPDPYTRCRFLGKNLNVNLQVIK